MMTNTEERAIDIPMTEAIIRRAKDRVWTEKYTRNCPVPLQEEILTKDEQSGLEISVAYYPAGYHTILHRHTIAHGMYVLNGRLQTNEGLLEPGDFIWFPEGTAMEHGAPQDSDCTVLFVTNGPFDIEYLEQDVTDEKE